MVQFNTILGKQDWEINLLLLKIFFSKTLQAHKNISQPNLNASLITLGWIVIDFNSNLQ